MADVLSLPASPHEKFIWLSDLVFAGKLVDPSEIVVTLALAAHHNSKTGRLFPSAARIAEFAKLSVRKVEQTIRELVERGVVRKRRRFGSSTLYELVGLGNDPAPRAEPPPDDPAQSSERCGTVCRMDPEQGAGDNPVNLSSELNLAATRDSLASRQEETAASSPAEPVADDIRQQVAADPSVSALWHEMRNYIRSSEDGRRFDDNWLAKARAEAVEGGRLTLVVENRVIEDWINRERPLLLRAAGLAGCDLNGINFVVKEPRTATPSGYGWDGKRSAARNLREREADFARRVDNGEAGRTKSGLDLAANAMRKAMRGKLRIVHSLPTDNSTDRG